MRRADRLGAQSHQLGEGLALGVGRGPAQEAWPSLGAEQGQPAGVDRVGLGPAAPRSDEGLDLGGVGAVSRQADGEGGVQRGSFVTAGGFADGQVMAGVVGERGTESLEGVGHGPRPAGGQIVQGDAGLADVEAEDAGRFGGRPGELYGRVGFGHDRIASDCLRARPKRRPFQVSKQAEAGSPTDPDDNGVRAPIPVRSRRSGGLQVVETRSPPTGPKTFYRITNRQSRPERSVEPGRDALPTSPPGCPGAWS